MTNINFPDTSDSCFYEFLQIVDSRMKDLLQRYVGTNTRQADPISKRDEDKLWMKGVFGDTDSKTLQLTIFFYCCKFFGLRAEDEHRNLDCSQFLVSEDSKGPFIRFTGRATKTFKGGLGHMSLTNKKLTQYCNEGMCIFLYFKPSSTLYVSSINIHTI